MTATDIPVAGSIESPWPEIRSRSKSRRLHVDSADGFLVAGAAGLGLAVFVIARRALADDALITLSYARNLAEHGEWALVHGIAANTATSPLNVWLLAALIWLVGKPMIACGLLLAGLMAASAFWLRRMASMPAAILGIAVLASSPVLLSSIGLETYLAVAVMIGLTRYALSGRWSATAVLMSAAVLTRPDMATVALTIVAASALAGRQWRGPLVATLQGAVAPLAWHLFTWWRLGSFVPDTMPAKTVGGADSWGPWRYRTGLGMYLLDFPRATTATVALVTSAGPR